MVKSSDAHRTGHSPLLWSLLAALLLLSGCDVASSGSDDPPDPTEYTKTVTATGEGGQQLSGVTFSYDGQTEAGVSSVEITRQEGTTLAVQAEKAGYVANSIDVTFEDGTSESIPLAKDHPDTVQISYEIRSEGSDSLVAGDLYEKGGQTLAENSSDGTISLPYGTEAITLCTAPEYFAEDCREMTPDGDTSITLRPARKSVDGEASVSPSSGTLYVNGEEIATGSFTDTFPMQAGTRTISASADGYGEQSREVAADEAFDVSFSLNRVYACNDGIDNNSDGLIDEEDPGCIDSDRSTSRDPDSDGFVYEPEDDREGLKGFQRSGGMTSVNRFVSSKKDERLQGLASTTFPDHIQSAVGEIEIEVKNLVESNQSGEEFALWVVCSDSNEDPRGNSKTRTTKIVSDDGSSGWRLTSIHGMNSKWTSEGTSCGFYAIHGTKAKGESTGDGNDDVFFSDSNTDGVLVFTWFYEPEEL